MKRNRLALSVLNILVMVCVLILQAGCEEEAMEPRTLNPEWFNQQRWAAINQQAPQSMVATTPPVKGAPRIEFEKLTHNFGSVGPGTQHICEFRFTNTGNGVLKINEISKICGCTPFSLDKTEYAPGESGSLKVGYYADDQYGNTRKQLFVSTNDRQNPRIALNIDASIVAKVDIEPKSLRLSLKHQNGDCPQIVLTSVDNQPFSIRSFKSTAGCMTADYNPSETASRFVLQPKVDMAMLEQIVDGRIEIELTHPECKIVGIDLHALPRYDISPRPIVIRDVRGSSAVTKKVRIKNNYKDLFEVESVQSQNGTVEFVDSRKINDGYELDLRITPPAQSGRVGHFTDIVVVKLKNGGTLEIPCNGFYPRPANVSRVPIAAPNTTTTNQTTTKSAKECKTCGPKVF